MPAGYSQTPLWKKLGVREGECLVLVDPPRDWTVPDLPDRAWITIERGLSADAAAPLIVAFCSAVAGVREAIPVLARRILPAGAIWVAWPRRAGGHESDIREQDIRSLALAIGLVDVKVAALDEDWSGLRLVWRRERRQASTASPG